MTAKAEKSAGLKSAERNPDMDKTIIDDITSIVTEYVPYPKQQEATDKLCSLVKKAHEDGQRYALNITRQFLTLI
jgi:hypothetical protein